MNPTFYRGENVNFYPTDDSLALDDFTAKYIAPGVMPIQPFISQDTIVVAFGSCFARHISDHLAAIGYRVESRRSDKAYISVMGDGIVNTYAILQQFEWAWEGKVPEVPLWHGYEGQEFGYDEQVRLETKRIFDTADVFIVTLGLSEIWYDEPTGQVFWRAVPQANFDPARHKFRVATHSENLANLAAMHAIIRKHRPQARIVVTLSPIALTATFRPVAGIVANSVSKANLRSALDEFFSAYGADDRLHYFPSYEIATACFDRPYAPDRRHVHVHVLEFNMRMFERYYCLSGIDDAKLLRYWRRAQRIDRKFARLGSDFAKRYYEERQAKRTAEIRAARIEQRRAARLDARRAAKK
jgi:GSCFA family